MKPKTFRARFWLKCEDCAWWWDRNSEGFFGGLALGILLGVIAFEFVAGI